MASVRSWFQRFRSSAQREEEIDRLESRLPTYRADAMNLAERIAFRRDMLVTTMREVFLANEILTAMYKFTVAQMDERGHSFSIYIEIAQDFNLSNRPAISVFMLTERLIKAQAYERWGVVLYGLYWRVTVDASTFKKPLVMVGSRNHEHVSEAPKSSGARDPLAEADTVPNENWESQYRAEQIDRDSAKKFGEKIKRGETPEPLKVGNQWYHSDIMPEHDPD